jgi:hypothetical protein
MPIYPSPEEMGLTRETLYDENKAMLYWLLYGPKDFIQTSVSEMKEVLFRTITLLEDFKDPEVASVQSESIWGAKTVGEQCEAIQKYTAVMRKMLDIMFRYSKEYPFSNASSTDKSKEG